MGAEVIKIEPALNKSMNPANGDGDMIRGAGMARAIVNREPYPALKSVQLPSAQPFKCADGKWVYLMGNDWPSAVDGFCKIMDMLADAKQKWPTYMDAAKAKAEIKMNYPGEHTVQQFKAIGYTDEQIQELLDKGTATQLDPETYEYDRFNITKPGTTYNIIMGGMSMGG